MPLFGRSDKPLVVELPPPSKDRALSSKVGLIAVAGFALGVAWPRLLDLQVGPPPPDSGDRSAGGAPRAGKGPASSAAPSAPASSDVEAPDEGPTNKQSAVVGDGTVRACKNKKGDKLDDCGKLAIDKYVKPRLAELAGCPAALGLEGKLTIGVSVNFEKSEIVVVEDDKSDLPSSTVRGVFACAGEELKGIELDKIPHTHPRYTIAYPVAFHPPGRAPEPEASASAAPEAGDLGRAVVAWEKALVREAPKEGKIVARLAQGTRVKVLEQNDDWYKIESGKSKGWVYRQAIGK
jgi:hypothetical protein